jgi:hypothetical protein
MEKRVSKRTIIHPAEAGGVRPVLASGNPKTGSRSEPWDICQAIFEQIAAWDDSANRSWLETMRVIS